MKVILKKTCLKVLILSVLHSLPSLKKLYLLSKIQNQKHLEYEEKHEIKVSVLLYFLSTVGGSSCNILMKPKTGKWIPAQPSLRSAAFFVFQFSSSGLTSMSGRLQVKMDNKTSHEVQHEHVQWLHRDCVCFFFLYECELLIFLRNLLNRGVLYSCLIIQPTLKLTFLPLIVRLGFLY